MAHRFDDYVWRTFGSTYTRPPAHTFFQSEPIVDADVQLLSIFTPRRKPRLENKFALSVKMEERFSSTLHIS